MRRLDQYEYHPSVLDKFKNFFKKNDIQRISKNLAQPDDLLVFSAQNKSVSHFAIMLDDDQFMQHQMGTLSSKRMLDDVFLKKIHSVYRIANK